MNLNKNKDKTKKKLEMRINNKRELGRRTRMDIPEAFLNAKTLERRV